MWGSHRPCAARKGDGKSEKAADHGGGSNALRLQQRSCDSVEVAVALRSWRSALHGAIASSGARELDAWLDGVLKEAAEALTLELRLQPAAQDCAHAGGVG